MIISRRSAVAGLVTGGAVKPALAQPTMSAAERLDTMVRMRAGTDGRIYAGWLDAVRSTAALAAFSHDSVLLPMTSTTL